jgi:GTPase SAR1 family protein
MALAEFAGRRNDLTCPYCFARMPRRRVEFRCRGRVAGQSGCAEEPDQKYATFTGLPAEPRSPVFAADGRRPRALCPACGLESAHRVCPECHSHLPGSYLDSASRIVALVGAKGAGKSTYIAVLIHELQNRVGAELSASLVECDDRTRRRYREEFHTPLFGSRRLLPVTQSAATRLNNPLIYTLTLGRSGLLRRGNPALTLVLFDNAGEDFTSDESVDRHLRYLGAADAVLFLMDSLELPGDGPQDVIGRVTEMLRGQHGMPAGRPLPVPVGVALTKIDAIRGDLSATSALRRPRPTTGALDLIDREAVHEEVRALLDSWQTDALDRFLEHNYRTYGLFALSALGNVPDGETVNPLGIQPYRVEDPLLWLLHGFGMVPAARRRGRS